jgi:ATP synthase protein I
MGDDSGRNWGEAWSLAFTLVGFVLVFTGLGYVVDRWVGTRPWLMVAGVFVGFILGLVYLVMLSGSSGGHGGSKSGKGGEGPSGHSIGGPGP